MTVGEPGCHWAWSDAGADCQRQEKLPFSGLPSVVGDAAFEFGSLGGGGGRKGRRAGLEVGEEADSGGIGEEFLLFVGGELVPGPQSSADFLAVVLRDQGQQRRAIGCGRVHQGPEIVIEFGGLEAQFAQVGAGRFVLADFGQNQSLGFRGPGGEKLLALGRVHGKQLVERVHRTLGRGQQLEQFSVGRRGAVQHLDGLEVGEDLGAGQRGDIGDGNQASCELGALNGQDLMIGEEADTQENGDDGHFGQPAETGVPGQPGEARPGSSGGSFTLEGLQDQGGEIAGHGGVRQLVEGLVERRFGLPIGPGLGMLGEPRAQFGCLSRGQLSPPAQFSPTLVGLLVCHGLCKVV